MEQLTEKDMDKIENQLRKFKEFTLFTNSKEKEFLIEIYTNIQYLMIIGLEKKTNYMFKNILALNDLYQIDKYFKLFNSPEDIANDIYELYQKNSIYLECERLSFIYLIINWEFNTKKQETKIKLIGKESNKELHLIQISNKLDLLEKQSNQEINELKKEISQLKLDLKEKDNRFNNLVNLFQIKSTIINYFSEYEFLLKEVQAYTNQKVNNLILLYRATRDGDKYDTFKSSVYQKNNIIILIRNDKGYRFGGFISTYLEENNNYNDIYKNDDKAFLFSLYKEKSYPIKIPNQAVRLNRDKLFIFGNGDILVNKGFLNIYNYNGGGITEQKSYDYKGEQAALSGVNGKSFKIMEIEAYQCKFC